METLFEINKIHKYEILETISDFSRSKVVKAQNKKTKKIVAIKIMENFERANNEFNTLSLINHENVIKVYEIFSYNYKKYLVMEFMPKSLYDYVEKNKISENECKRLFKSLLNVIKFLHNNNIYHRDIKLENILLDENNNIKLCDFEFTIFTLKSFNDYNCTINYAAPEIMQRYNCFYNDKVDIWCLGILLFAIFFQTFPFIINNKMDPYLKFIRLKQYKLFWEAHETNSQIIISKKIKLMFNKIFVYNLNDRINLENLLKEPWLQHE